MVADEKDEKEGEAQEQPKPKSKKKLIIIAAAAVVVIAVALVLLLRGGKAKEEAAAAAAKEEQTTEHLMTAKLDTFIVNLSESSSFLKTTILIEYNSGILARASSHGKKGGEGHGSEGTGGASPEGAGGLPAIMKEREPMIKDAVIRVLSSKKAQELLTVEGKDALKEELVEAINDAIGLEEAPVVNVYFIDFIIQ